MSKMYKVQGASGVLVQLHPFDEATTKTTSGLIVPKFKDYETDGGRWAAKMDVEKFSLVGTIVQLSEKCKEIMEQEKMDYKEGDVVAVKATAKQTYNWFITDKNTPVADWTGLLLITPHLLECKIEEENDEDTTE